jgi:hypothetical protein
MDPRLRLPEPFGEVPLGQSRLLPQATDKIRDAPVASGVLGFTPHALFMGHRRRDMI